MSSQTINANYHNFTQQPIAAGVGQCFKSTLKNYSPATSLALLLLGSGMASAATFQVTNTNDAGPGSLRQAIEDANINSGADEIDFAASAIGTVNLTTGALEILDTVTISGPGSANFTIDTGGSSEIFLITDSVDPLVFSVSDLTLTNATTAILEDSVYLSPEIIVQNCTITGSVNSGIFLNSYFGDPNLAVSDTIITDNAQAGIAVIGDRYSVPESTLERVTVNNNGYGVINSEGWMDIKDSVISGNTTGMTVWGGYYKGGSTSVTDSVITGNQENGVELGDFGSLAADNSTISSNGGAGVFSLQFSNNLNRVGAEIRNSTVADNNAGGVVMLGGVAGKFLIENSTISGNHNGFGVAVDQPYILEEFKVANSTITGNDSGGIYNSIWALDISNSIVAGNNAGGGEDLSGDIPYFSVAHSLIENPGTAIVTETVAGSNIIGLDPMLGALQDNGGSTLTHALLDNSPAIDQGDNATCLSEDQRGVARPQDGDGDNLAVCDMGAFELTDSTTQPGTGSMGDRVWRDINGDGVQDSNEPGLGGVVVNLRVNCDADNLLTTVTDSDGAFLFAALPVGSYQLEFVKPDGYSFSPYIAAGDYQNDNNADPVTGLDQCRSLSIGQNRLALDAGLVPSLADGNGVMGDYVWRDDNGDGVQDPAEPGLEGVTVKLHVNCDSTHWLSTTTDKNGAFAFDRLPVKNYRLEYITPAGYEFSPAIAAQDYTRDSNADTTTGRDICRALPAGRKRIALDAGLVPNP